MEITVEEDEVPSTTKYAEVTSKSILESLLMKTALDDTITKQMLIEALDSAVNRKAGKTYGQAPFNVCASGCFR